MGFVDDAESWLGFGDVNIVPPAMRPNVDRTTTTGRHAERSAADTAETAVATYDEVDPGVTGPPPGWRPDDAFLETYGIERASPAGSK